MEQFLKSGNQNPLVNLAQRTVGDNGTVNLYFVGISNSMVITDKDGETHYTTNNETGESIFNIVLVTVDRDLAIEQARAIELTENGIPSVLVEDRQRGVILERYLRKIIGITEEIIEEEI